MAWAPVGDHIAYFARTEKEKTLVIQNVVTGKTEKKIHLKPIDGPSRRRSARTARRSSSRRSRAPWATCSPSTSRAAQITNLTKDASPTTRRRISPDGKTIVYTAHVSGNDKLFQLDLATGQKKQLTFGTHDDTGAKFFDDHTIVFTSTATDPNVRSRRRWRRTATSRTSGRWISARGS